MESQAVSNSATKSRERIPELDGLRGTAILLVILCHYVGVAEHSQLGVWPHRFLSAFAIGWTGVDLFFVLSGFLIGGILVDARNSPNYFKTFYMRRVFRIFPIYYLWIAIFAGVVLARTWFLHGGISGSTNELMRVPVQLLFLQNYFAEMPALAWIWFGVTWSLAVEEQFYLVAPPLIRFFSPKKIQVLLVTTICLAPLLRLYVLEHVKEGNYLAVFAMPCRADALAWGILLAIGWRSKKFREWLQTREREIRWSVLAMLA